MWLGLSALALAAAAASCGSSTDASVFSQGSGAAAGAGAAGGAGGEGGAAAAEGGAGVGAGGVGGAVASTGSGVAVPTEVAECQGKIYACGDLEDNDLDGLVDSQDPDCLGPCDNTEGSYFGGIPGQNQAPCKMDCYFDQDTGSGNDDCHWSHQCDPHSVAPNYYPEPNNGAQCAYDEDLMVSVPGGPKSCDTLDAAQSPACESYCGPLTPNGCDCFGCCELPAGSDSFVWLGSVGADGDTVCTIDQLDEPTVCHPCKPVAGCFNDCEVCELCVGKTELPPECFDPEGSGGAGAGGAGAGGNGAGGAGGAPQDCGGETEPCGLPGQDPCPSGKYCITGCCITVPK